MFVGLVVVHEFGHFIVARRNGVEVEEFGVGFPPRIWKKKMKAGYDFTVNLLPIGGFVRLKGESDSATKAGSFGAASTRVKTKIMLAGVAMNLVVAFGLFTILAWVGMPQLVDKQFNIKSDAKIARSEVLVGYVEPSSPAARVGITTEDKIIAIGLPGDLQKIQTANQVPDVTKELAGQRVDIQIKRDGKLLNLRTTLRNHTVVEASKKSNHPKGYLGVSPTDLTITRSTWSAPIVGAGLVVQLTAATFHGLGSAISAIFQGDGSRAAEQVSGPVGVIVLLKNGSLLGFEFVLMIIAIISLTLAIMNILPIPALDGGRLYMMLLSRLSGKKLSEAMEERIVGASFIFLIFLIILITVVDVRRFF